MSRLGIDLVIRLTLIASLLFTALPPMAVSAKPYKIPTKETALPAASPDAAGSRHVPDLPVTESLPPVKTDSFVPVMSGSKGPAGITSAITSTTYLPVILSDGSTSAATSEMITSTLYLPLVLGSHSASPIANFSAEPLQGRAPLTVTFTNRSNDNFDSFRWNYGDGSTLSTTTDLLDPVPPLTHTHIYTQPGIFTVALTAMDLDSTTTLTRPGYITVEPAPAGTISELGGVITSTDGRVILSFAPGAVTETLDIFIDQVDLIPEYTTPEGEIIQGMAYDGLPFRLLELNAKQPGGSSIPDLHFQAPVQLTYLYSTEVISAAGLIEDSLTFIFHNAALEQIEPIPTTVQTETLQLTAPITHFSTYGVAGDSATWSAPSVDAFEVALSKGSASYSYDIPLPAGPNGFGPKLSLQYNSGIVNGLTGNINPDTGWVGTGWTLELGEITWQQVGSKNVPGKRNPKPIYDFRLTLNGTNERLLPDESRLDDETRHFQTEHQTFMKVEAPGRVDKMGHSTSGSWKVIDKNGTTYYFGTDQDGRGSILRYSSIYNKDRSCALVQYTYKLYKIVDIHGNTVEIEYDSLPGRANGCVKPGDTYLKTSSPESYPKVIKYTTNARAGDNHAEYQIKFITENKGYTARTKGNITNKLTDIDLSYFPKSGPEQFIRRLHFDYETEITSGSRQERRHLLTGLQLSDAPAAQGGSTLPEFTFNYAYHQIKHTWGKRGLFSTEWDWINSTWMRPFLKLADNGYGANVDYEYSKSNDGRFQVVAARHVADAITGLSGTYRYLFDQPKIVENRYGLADTHIYEIQLLNFGRFFGFALASVIDPLGNVTKKYFDNSYDADVVLGGGPDILNGYEQGTWIYDTGGTNLYSASIPTWSTTQAPWPATFVYKSQQNDYMCDGQISADNHNRDNLRFCVHRQMTSEYDHNTGNLLKQTEYKADGSRYRSTEYTYAPNWDNWLLSLPIRQTLLAANGNLLTENRFHYDGGDYAAAPTEGNLTLQRQWAGGNNYVDVSYSQYDAYGNVGQSTSYDDYNSHGMARLDKITYDQHGLLPVETTNPLGFVSSTKFDYRFQKPVAETDPNGAVTAYAYDSFGRLTTVMLPACPDAPVFKANYFDHSISPAAPYREMVEQRIDDCAGGAAGYAQTHVYYDGFGRKIQTRTQGDESGQFIVSGVKYDELGRATHTLVPDSATSHDYQPVSWTPGNFTLTAYDLLGRVSQVTQPDMNVTKTFYHGLSTGMIDPNGHQKISETDVFGRLVQVKEFTGIHHAVDWGGSAYGTTTYEYDEQDNLRQVVDAANSHTTITYDRLGRKTGMDDPDMGQWYYFYDAAGNLVAQVDAKHQATNMYYDAINRLVDKSYSPGSVANPADYRRPFDPGPYPITYRYDQSDAEHGAGIGRRTGMTDEAGTVNWRYDLQGRLLSESRQFEGPYSVLNGSKTYVTRFSYDAADRAITVTYPDGEQVVTTYTDRGLPETLTGNLPGDVTTDYIASAVYNALGHVTGRTAGNGLTTAYSYYTAAQHNHRLRQIRVSSQANNSLLDITYADYDGAGNIQAVLDQSSAVGNQTLNFTYDHLDRLITATANPAGNLSGFNHGYQYSPIGNIAAKIEDGQQFDYSYDSDHPHAVASIEPASDYQYDPNGNMVSRTEKDITYTQAWNVENKLEQVTWTEPGGQIYTTTFIYDGDANRLLKIEQLGKPAPSEITTVYIGQIYEEQFDTTADNLGRAAAMTAYDVNSNLAISIVPAQPANLARPAGLASPLFSDLTTDLKLQSSRAVVTQRSSLTLPPAQQAEPLDPWVDAVVSYQTGSGGGQGSPANVIGPYNTNNYSLGAGPGHIIVDMGPGEEAVCNGSNADLKIYEIGPGAEAFYISVSNSPTGSWTRIDKKFSKTGGNAANAVGISVDLADALSPVSSIRYIRIESADGDPCSGGCVGPDVAAIQAFHMCAPNPLPPVITSPADGSILLSSSVTASGYAGSNVTVDLYVNGVFQKSTTSNFNGSWSIAGVNLNPGTNQLTARAFFSGKTSNLSTPVTVIYDAAPPVTTITQPGMDGMWLSGIYNFRGQTTDQTAGLTVKYQVDDDNWISSSAAGSAYNWSFPIDTTRYSTGGPHDFRVQGVDQHNKVEPVKTRSFYVDNVLPAASMDSLAPYLNTPTFAVGWSASDHDSGLAATNPFEVQVSEAGGPWELWQITAVDSGDYDGTNGSTYSFRVRARDNANNTGDWSSEVSTTIDTISPEIGLPQIDPRFFSPNGDGLIDTTAMSAVITDTNLAGWTAAILSGTTTLITTSGVEPVISWLWDGRDSNGQVLPDGDYTMAITATDRAGNRAEFVEPNLVSIDTTPPVIDLWQPYAGQTVNIAAIKVSGFRESTNVAVAVNGQPATYGGPGLSLYQNTVSLTPGKNIITVQGTDPAYNTTVVSRTILYDPDAPAVTDFSPTGPVSHARPTISANFSDGSNPNIISHTVTLDGRAIPSTAAGFSYIPAMDLSQGEHVVRVTLTDAGGQTSTASWSFWIDTWSWIELSTPPDGSLVNRSPITVTGRTELGAEVDLQLNGIPVGSTVTDDGHFSIGAIMLSPGSNMLTANSTDPLGNEAQADIMVNFDDTMPAASVTAVPDSFSPGGSDPQPETTFEMTAYAPAGQDLAAWSLAVSDGSRLIRQWQGNSEPPDRQTWDGRDSTGVVVGDGVYLYRLTVTSTQGLTGVSPAGQVTVDTSRPDPPVIILPTDPTSQVDSSVLVQGMAEPETMVTLQSGVFTTVVPADNSGNWSTIFPLESGLNTLTATATDAAGQVSDPSDALHIWVTVEPPLYTAGVEPDIVTHGTGLTLEATARGDDSPEGLPTVSVTATVPDSGPLDLVKLGTQPLTTTWQITWTVPAGTANGLRTVSFMAVDEGGLFGTGHTALIVDSVGPSTPWLSSPRGETWMAKADVLVIGRSDPLDQITIHANYIPLRSITADSTGAWQATVTLPEGYYILQARAGDAAGNQSSLSNAAAVRVDLTPPTVRLNAPPTSGRQVDLSWGSDDGSGSGVAGYEVEYRDGTGLWTAWFPATTGTAATFAAMPQHHYYFRIRAIDRVGHLSDWVEAGPVEIKAVTKYYTFGGTRVAMRQGDMVYYLHGDHLGSTTLTTDDTGAVVAESRYLLYGQLRWSNGPSPTDFGFTGQRHEASFGLLDYNARYYDPRSGRFISPDTIVPEPGNPQGFNRYAYVSNNPLKFVDPDGHCQGLAGAAFNVCAQVVLALAPAVHQANEYREDIFFPDADTTFGERLEASMVVGGGATLLAAAGVELTAGTLTTAATVGTATTASTTASTAATAACSDGDCTNEAQATQRVFWSGGDMVKEAAQAWARTNDRITLEMTRLGQNVEKATKGFDWLEAKPHWANASQEFAAGAEGEVHVFHNSQGVFLESVWGKVEYQTLVNNPKVTEIIYHVIMPNGGDVIIP